MVGNLDHLRTDLSADARDFRHQPVFLCDVGSAKSADLVPNATHGHVRLLPQGRFEKSDRTRRDLQRPDAISGDCDLLHVPNVSVPRDRTLVPGLPVRQMDPIGANLDV